MTALTFEDFIKAANGGETESESLLENFFKEPVKPFKFNDVNKQPAAGGNNGGPNNLTQGESFQSNFG